MLNRNLEKIIVMAVLALSTLTAQASGFGAGNGGDGVLIGNDVYLYDFVEAGIENQPYFQNINHINPGILAQLEGKFDRNVFPIDLLAAKITEMAETSKLEAFYMLGALKTLEWRVVNFDLVNVDDGASVIVVNPANMVQLAVRRQGIVSINSRYWNTPSPTPRNRRNRNAPILNDENKVGLLMHEAAYAAMPFQDHTVRQRRAESLCQHHLATPPQGPAPLVNVYVGSQESTARRDAYAQCVVTMRNSPSVLQSSDEARQYVGNLFSTGGLSRSNSGQAPFTLIRDSNETFQFVGDLVEFLNSLINFENHGPVVAKWVKIVFTRGIFNHSSVSRVFDDQYASSPLTFRFAPRAQQIKALSTSNIQSDCVRHRNSSTDQDASPRSNSGTLFAGEGRLDVAAERLSGVEEGYRIALTTSQNYHSFSELEQGAGSFARFDEAKQCAKQVRQFLQLPQTP